MIIVYIAVTIVVALSFYMLRCRRQLWYGVCEIIVAFLVIYLSFKPPYTTLALNQGYSPIGIQVQHYYGTLACIYIFVRGMDNIRTGLPVTRRTCWDDIFFGCSRREGRKKWSDLF